MADQIENTAAETNTSVAVGPNAVGYGFASGATEVAPSLGGLINPGLWVQMQFLWGEYFKGILFVLASTVFILAVPRLVTKRDQVRELVARISKRTVDIVGSIVGLILTLPVWLILPILIKLDSSGPVFYCQTRVGRNSRGRDRRYCQRLDAKDRRTRDRRRDDCHGRPFSVIKFRTMIQDAEKASGPVWATKDDPRVTKLGNFMRKTRLDEIPQFVNVLTGEMSLVGPRPERPNFVSQFADDIPDYRRRLEAKPGLTGLAQVSSGYDSSVASVKEKLGWDLNYVDNWSLWLDIKILCRTVVVVLTGRGAC